MALPSARATCLLFPVQSYNHGSLMVSFLYGFGYRTRASGKEEARKQGVCMHHGWLIGRVPLASGTRACHAPA